MRKVPLFIPVHFRTATAFLFFFVNVSFVKTGWRISFGAPADAAAAADEPAPLATADEAVPLAAADEAVLPPNK